MPIVGVKSAPDHPPSGATEMTLEVERWLKGNYDRLLAEHPGKYLAIYGPDLFEAGDNYLDAFNKARKTSGGKPVIVQYLHSGSDVHLL